jgi:hypothetical protein
MAARPLGHGLCRPRAVVGVSRPGVAAASSPTSARRSGTAGRPWRPVASQRRSTWPPHRPRIVASVTRGPKPRRTGGAPTRGPPSSDRRSRSKPACRSTSHASRTRPPGADSAPCLTAFVASSWMVMASGCAASVPTRAGGPRGTRNVGAAGNSAPDGAVQLRICARNKLTFCAGIGTNDGVGPVSPYRADVLRRHLELR